MRKPFRVLFALMASAIGFMVFLDASVSHSPSSKTFIILFKMVVSAIAAVIAIFVFTTVLLVLAALLAKQRIRYISLLGARVYSDQNYILPKVSPPAVLVNAHTISAAGLWTVQILPFVGLGLLFLCTVGQVAESFRTTDSQTLPFFLGFVCIFTLLIGIVGLAKGPNSLRRIIPRLKKSPRDAVGDWVTSSLMLDMYANRPKKIDPASFEPLKAAGSHIFSYAHCLREADLDNEEQSKFHLREAYETIISEGRDDSAAAAIAFSLSCSAAFGGNKALSDEAYQHGGRLHYDFGKKTADAGRTFQFEDRAKGLQMATEVLKELEAAWPPNSPMLQYSKSSLLRMFPDLAGASGYVRDRGSAGKEVG